jgi:hypothetical protein
MLESHAIISGQDFGSPSGSRRSDLLTASDKREQGNASNFSLALETDQLIVIPLREPKCSHND